MIFIDHLLALQSASASDVSSHLRYIRYAENQKSKEDQQDKHKGNKRSNDVIVTPAAKATHLQYEPRTPQGTARNLLLQSDYESHQERLKMIYKKYDSAILNEEHDRYENFNTIIQ